MPYPADHKEKRQQEVNDLLAAGYSYQEIQEILGICRQTLAQYKPKIKKRKLTFRDRIIKELRQGL